MKLIYTMGLDRQYECSRCLGTGYRSGGVECGICYGSGYVSIGAKVEQMDADLQEIKENVERLLSIVESLRGN